MGVDHGLGGRESDKSKFKRKRKAARHKSEILRSIVENPNELKKGVVFNEEARTEWLSGFHKRKQKRRAYGVAMQILKEKKARKDLKNHRSDAKSSTNSEKDEGKDSFDENSSDGGDDAVNIPNNNLVADDDHTRQMFGGVVSVSVDTGIAQELEEFRTGSSSSTNNQKPTQSRKQIEFEKAIKAAKYKLNNAKSQKKNKYFNNKSADSNLKNKSTSLLRKALGRDTKKKKR